MVKFESSTKRRFLLALTIVLVGTVGLQHVVKTSAASPYLRRLSSQTTPIRPYDYTDIEKSASLFVGYYARILMFDGKDFSMYNIRDKKITIVNSAYGGRALRPIPLLVGALKSNFPERFTEGQPPFQVMYTDGDAINFGECTSHPQKCDMNHMPPLLAHGSVPKAVPDFPFVKAFPNWFYGDCIYNWKIQGEEGPCKSFFPGREGSLAEAEPQTWEDLIPTIVWRGSGKLF